MLRAIAKEMTYQDTKQKKKQQEHQQQAYSNSHQPRPMHNVPGFNQRSRSSSSNNSNSRGNRNRSNSYNNNNNKNNNNNNNSQSNSRSNSSSRPPPVLNADHSTVNVQCYFCKSTVQHALSDCYAVKILMAQTKSSEN
jgi:hypothetical protein